MTALVLMRMSVAALAATLFASVMQAQRPEFEAAFRVPGQAFLMTAVGEVYAVGASKPPHKAFVFASDQPSHPFRWTNPPKSFVRWHDEWIVANMTTRLMRFHANGLFAGTIDVPFRAARIDVSDEAVWCVNLGAETAATQVWRSSDGRVFAPVALGHTSKRFDSPADNLLILTGGRGGVMYETSIIGPPVVHRIWPLRTRRDITVAYSRTKYRATLDEIVGIVDDVTPYSLPIRDLVALDSGTLIVLRNREDVRAASGETALFLGRRVDEYGADGRQVATAELPSSAHWILTADSKGVEVINRSGDIFRATWGKPLPAQIVAQ